MKLIKRMLRNQAGQALAMALILMLLGALIIIPSLYLTTTNLNATRAVDEKTLDTYAADAGVQDGLWKVKNNYLPDWLSGKWVDATYTHTPPYSFTVHNSDIPTNTVPINDRLVTVTIKPIWVLEGLETPSSQGKTPNDSLITYGSIVGANDYEISIFYSGSGNILIQRIGCWLPPGFGYLPASSNLEKASAPLHCDHVESNFHGGKEITWTYPSGINYSALPAQGNKKIVTFEFTPTNGEPVDAFSWTRTTPGTNPYLSWDTSKKTFEITSTAPETSAKQTTIVSHSVKKEFQALGGAINGDYRATGITLMRDTDSNDSEKRRDRLYNATSATMKSLADDPTNGIPNDAIVEKIFLYWSGWKCKPWCAFKLTDTALNALPAQKFINKVALKVQVGTYTFSDNVTATNVQVMRNGNSSAQHGWSYACFADITDNVTSYFKNNNQPFYGTGTYTVGHWATKTTSDSTYKYPLYTWTSTHTGESVSGYTPYPLGSLKDGSPPSNCNTLDTGTNENTGSQDQWAYAAWSVIIIYTSPTTAGHHLYIFDEFKYCDDNKMLTYPVTGFLAPEDVFNNQNAARITCFVGEGDSQLLGDYLNINSTTANHLSDTVNPLGNVWNSKSNVLGGAGVDGVDIDTFVIGGDKHYINPGDTQATIYMPTTDDSWNLVYIVLSFYSEVTTGSMIDYNIEYNIQ